MLSKNKTTTFVFSKCQEPTFPKHFQRTDYLGEVGPVSILGIIGDLLHNDLEIGWSKHLIFLLLKPDLAKPTFAHITILFKFSSDIQNIDTENVEIFFVGNHKVTWVRIPFVQWWILSPHSFDLAKLEKEIPRSSI